MPLRVLQQQPIVCNETAPKTCYREQYRNAGGTKLAKNADKSDGQLVEEIRNGSNRAFEVLYYRYVGLVQFVVDKCRVSIEERDEIVQETFLKFLQRVHKVDDPGKVKAWLVVTARNSTLDRLRKYKRRKTEAAGDAIETESASTQQAGDRDPIRHELEVELTREFIEKVAAEKGGSSFREFYIDGMTARQIAEKNGESVSTVTTRLSRLRTRYKERLKEKITRIRERSV